MLLPLPHFTVNMNGAFRFMYSFILMPHVTCMQAKKFVCESVLLAAKKIVSNNYRC